jgi:very-short-patch-repair endonuclease
MEDKKVCEKCGVLVSKFAYNRHLRSCTGDPRKFRGGETCKEKFNFTGSCQYCGKDCRNLNSQRNHERCCNQNPNHTSLAGEDNPHFGGKGANQFTKARELGLPIPASTRKGKPSPIKGRKHTEETKARISKKQKENYKNKSRWYIQGRTKQSYAEKYFQDIFDNFSKKPLNNFKVDRFWLDFAWIDQMVYIEIDGEQHYIKDSLIERDKNREKHLLGLGWRCIKRIRWSHYKKLNRSEKENLIKELECAII